MATRKKKATKSGRAMHELDKSLLEAARRERTAIACMQGILAGADEIEPEEAARWAVRYADALLDELDGVADDEDEEDEEEYEDEDEDDEEG